MAELYTYTGSRISIGVKNKFGDSGAVQIDDAMIIAWINNGQRAIVAQSPFLKSSGTFNILAGQALYQLSVVLPAARIMSIHSLVVNGLPIPLVPWSEYEGYIERAGLQTSTGYSRWATMYGDDSLTIWPTPDTTITNGAVLFYEGYPADIVAITDKLTVPDRFYNALEDYVFAQALELDESYDAAKVKLGHFQVNLQHQFEVENRRPSDFYSGVTMDPLDDDGRYYNGIGGVI